MNMSDAFVKKPWYKKVWVWIIIVILLLGAVGTATEEEAEISNPNISTPTTSQNLNQTPASSAATTIASIPVVKQIAPIELVVIEYNQDYVGGNSVLITAINKTNKTIAWVQYDLYFLNVKGEILLDDIRGWSKMSIYHGPIEPYSRIEIKNGELFYNRNFHGKYIIDNVIIHYEDNSEKIIALEEFNNYEPFIYSSGDNLVICGKHHIYYHTNGNCSKLERNKNLCDLVMTIKEARAMGIIRCPECLPY